MGTTIFIGAGTQGSKKIKGVDKPYLEIAGKQNIQHVVDAALESERADKIIVWGDKQRLRDSLEDRLDDPRLTIIKEKGRITDNILEGTLEGFRQDYEDFDLPEWDRLSDFDWERYDEFRARHPELENCRYAFLPSDAPLVTAQEIDFLIDNVSDADLSIGFTRREALLDVLDYVRAWTGEKFKYRKSKMNFFKLVFGEEVESSRINTTYFWNLRILDEHISNISQRVYDDRELIGENGQKTRKGKLRRIISALSDYVKESAPEYALQHGVSEDKAREILTKHKNWLIKAIGVVAPSKYAPDKLVRKFKHAVAESAEYHLRQVTGRNIGLYLSNVVGLLLDIDTDYEAEYIDRNWNRLRKAIDSYYTKPHWGKVRNPQITHI